MIRDYDGLAVHDVTCEKIGTVERSFDDAEGAVRYVEIKMGTLFAHHRLVPVGDAQVTNGALTVPYTKTLIDHSPDASQLGHTLDGDLLDQITSYYQDIEPAPIQEEQAATAER